jgi:LPS sulfotransferase NodH
MLADESNILAFPRGRESLVSGSRFGLEWQRLKNGLRLAKKWWLRPHTPYQPFFVIATPRSGSNLLQSYLRQQPGVAALSEVLCPVLPIGPGRNSVPPAKAIKHIRYSLQGESTPVRGAKLMLHHLASCQLTLDDLHAAFPDAKYVILYRQSLAEQFVSQKAAMTTKQYMLFSGQERKQATVDIDAAELRYYCDGMRASYREAINRPWLAGRAVLLSYEELTADPEHWLSAHLGPLLGVSSVPLQTRLLKQNTLPLAQQITNYREVAGLLHSPLCRQHHVWPWQRHAQRRAA